MDLNSLEEKAKNEIENAKNLKELDEAYKKYLGKNGELNKILKTLKDLPIEERKRIGKKANQLKNSLEDKIEETKKIKKKKFQEEREEKEWIDVSAPGKKPEIRGHIHPLTQISNRAEEIFRGLGFSLIQGPEMEDEWHNFDALNIPKNHPARDMWDTFYLENDKLLRTHTSPVQIRFMENNNPPLRIIVPGRVFRYEATDASHEFNFHQLEGLMVDKKVSAANFRAIIEEFLDSFFEKDTEIRLRPSYFPFTEPSFEVDMRCINCGGDGCSVCSQTGWLELMGAGMVHPEVLKAAGYIPDNWQGFAFGMGLDRLAMLKYNIDDIRLFYSGDLRFLSQF